MNRASLETWESWLEGISTREDLDKLPELSAILWEACNPSLIKLDAGAHCTPLVTALAGSFHHLMENRPQVYSQLKYIEKVVEKTLGESELSTFLDKLE
jgi:hypothetical protein